MHLQIMHFIEDSESKDRTMLKLWRTDEDKIYVEMGPENEPDFMYSQFMTMDIDDAQALAGELMRIVQEIRGITAQGSGADSRRGVEPIDGPPRKKTKTDSAPLFKFQNDLNGNLTKVS